MKWTTAPVFVLLTMAIAATPEAQESVGTFGNLNSRLRIGDKVWVIDTQGCEHHGRLTGLQDAPLTLDAGAPTTFKAEVIREIRRQRRDSLLNGLLIGFGAGALIGQFAGGGKRCGSDPECLLYPGTYGVDGMGLGVLFDAGIPGREVVVYRATGRRAAARFHLKPVLTARTIGSGFSVSF